MEYSKDIIIDVKEKSFSNKKGQADSWFIKAIKKHKLLATISVLCGILIILDTIMINSFIVVLQGI